MKKFHRYAVIKGSNIPKNESIQSVALYMRTIHHHKSRQRVRRRKKLMIHFPSAMHIHYKSRPSGLHTRYPNKFMVERFVKGGVIYILYIYTGSNQCTFIKSPLPNRCRVTPLRINDTRRRSKIVTIHTCVPVQRSTNTMPINGAREKEIRCSAQGNIMLWHYSC